MAVHTLGTLATTSLTAVTYSPGVLSAADLASINTGIVGDGFAKSGGTGVITTGSTHTNTTLDSIGSMTRVQAGMWVFGVGIPGGTFLVSVNTGASSAVLSQAATATASGVNLMFVPRTSDPRGFFSFNGQLMIPRRGIIQVLPGDVVAVDNTGWPILISAASIAYTGSRWSLSA
jgi:hypothetical protein